MANWYACTVKGLTGLGSGFRLGGPAWARAAGDGRVIVHNRSFAIRFLSQEEARQVLELLHRLPDAESAEVEEKFQWELHR